MEKLTAPDAGGFNVQASGGAITGGATLGQLFFVFQERQYTVYQYSATDNPFSYITTQPYGCNSEATIIEYDGLLWYLAHDGSLRKTSGQSDVNVSERIKPFTNKILNSLNSADYYAGTGVAKRPCAYYDEYLNAYRLFYTSTNGTENDSCLTYFVDNDVFTTCSSTSVLSIASTFNIDGFTAFYGNADSSGITYSLNKTYSDTAKSGTLDLGWISSGNPRKQIRVQNVEIWYHTQAGETAADNCDCTLSIAVSIDPATDTTLKTITKAIAYNSTADNLQKWRFRVNVVGEYVHVKITDSGSKKNYALDRVSIITDELESIR